MTVLSIHVFASAGQRAGYGHLTRIAALLEAMRGMRACDVAFHTAPDSDLKALAPHAGRVLLCGDPARERIEDRGAMAIVDDYSIGSETLRRLGGQGLFRTAYDDNGIRGDNPCEVLATASAGEARDAYAIPAGALHCLGVEFAAIRPQVRKARGRSAQGAGAVTVTMGASDPDDATALCLEALRGQGFPLSVILGPCYAGRVTEKDAAFGLATYRAPEDMPGILAASGLVVCGAGMTALEAACLGRPMLLTALGPDQERSARALADAGVADYLGRLQDLSPGDVRRAAAALLSAPGKLERMSRAGAALVDGHGAERLARAVLTAYDAWRAAHADH